jgi:hypothetical protein
MSVEPIRPEDVVKLKTTIIPDQVIESFNKLIAKNFRNSSATFDQEGWSVKCDSPCWNETGNSYFTFTKKK